MYYEYFGFKQAPFKITPDPNLFFPGGNRGAILDALKYAILNGEGIVKVVGEVGSGKTMLCRMLEKELPEKVEIVYLANPSLAPENTLHAIAFELKLPVQHGTPRIQVMNELQEFLVKRHGENKQVVVFVEEAQGMPLATLEEIRLLSNLETSQNKLLQIVLFGQPELDEMIATPEIRQLKERITYSFQLNPFETNDISDYIITRLRSCGYRSGELFENAAIAAIERYSQGLVRRINILSDKALLAAYASNTHTVTARHVSQAARDSEFVTATGMHWRRLAYPVTAVLLVVLSLVLYLQINPATPDPAGLLASNPAMEQSTPVGKLENPETGKDTPGSAAIVPVEMNNDEQVEERVRSVAEDEPGTGTITPKKVEKLEESVSNELYHGSMGEAQFNESQVASINESPGNEDMDAAGGDEASPLSGVGTPGEVASEAELDEDLMDLNSVFLLQDLGDSRLSTRESLILKEQLKTLPPEEVIYADTSLNGDVCQYCWSIIYRPLINPENL